MTPRKSLNRADALIYRALQKAVAENKLRIYLDYGRVNRPLSPIYNPWETLLPILLPVLFGLVLMLLTGVLFGLLFIIGMVMIYAHVIKKKLFRRIIERAKTYITSDYEKCCELWEFGGIVLVNADNKKIGCVAPDGDWKEFVVLNYADLMTEKQEPSPDEKADAGN